MSEVQGINAEDVAVTLAVREELGPEHEAAVVAEFLERVGHKIDAQVDERVRAMAPAARGGWMWLPLASLVLGVPITDLASEHGVAGIGAAWAGIAAVNAVNALRR